MPTGRARKSSFRARKHVSVQVDFLEAKVVSRNDLWVVGFAFEQADLTRTTSAPGANIIRPKANFFFLQQSDFRIGCAKSLEKSRFSLQAVRAPRAHAKSRSGAIYHGPQMRH